MKRKVFLLSAIILALVLGSPFALIALRNRQDRIELNRVSEMAKKEGLPTTHAEFVAILPKLETRDNAAECLRLLPDSRRLGFRPDIAISSSLYGSSKASSLAKAKAFVVAQNKNLAFLEQAGSRRHCQFDKEWQKDVAGVTLAIGNSRLWTEVALARGDYYSRAGNPKKAVEDALLAYRIAELLGETPYWIGPRSRSHIETSVLTHLANWALANPREPLYRKAIERLVSLPSRNDVQRAWLYSAALATDIIDLCKTAKGRAYVGLKESEVGAWEGLSQRFRPTVRAKTKVIELLLSHHRISADPSQDLIRFDYRMADQMDIALANTPSAHRILRSLYDTAQTDQALLYGDEMRKLAFKAFLRATASGGPSSRIETSDLKCPMSNKPVEYRWNGQTMVIVVDSGGVFTYLKVVLEKR